MDLDDERCPECGLLYRMVGRRHNCRGRKVEVKAGGFSAPPREPEGIAEGREAAPGLPVATEPRGQARSLDRGDANPKGGAVAPEARRPAGGIKAPPSGKETSTVRRGRPLRGDRDKTLEATKPWEAEGMSRRTWFKRKAEGKL